MLTSIARTLALMPILTSFGLVSSLAPSPAQAQQQEARVQVDRVVVEPLTQTAPVLGRIVTQRDGVVAAQVEGAVEVVNVRVGDRVEPGDILVALESERMRIERDLAQAEYEAALVEQDTVRAEMQMLEDERSRMERLRTSAAFSAAQMDDKENEIAVAETRINGARARLQQYRTRLERAAADLEDTTIRAPYGGVVSIRQVAPGAYVRVGDPVVTLIDDTALEIEADVPSDRIAGLGRGTEVGVRLDDGTEHTATVRAIVPEENPMTRTRAVRLSADFSASATEKPLAVAQSATLLVPIGSPKDVVTVHKDAILQQGSGAIVFVAAGGEATPRPVVIGNAVGSRFEVSQGLKPGELVVVRGNERLRPGQPISFAIPEDGETAPTAAAGGASSS